MMYSNYLCYKCVIFMYVYLGICKLVILRLYYFLFEDILIYVNSNIMYIKY